VKQIRTQQHAFKQSYFLLEVTDARLTELDVDEDFFFKESIVSIGTPSTQTNPLGLLLSLVLRNLLVICEPQLSILVELGQSGLQLGLCLHPGRQLLKRNIPKTFWRLKQTSIMQTRRSTALPL
jgi:hypothetical protein